MPSYDYDIGIIGGGAAGLTVAAGAAQLGAKTLLIEKEKDLGGDCLHYGCVPSKTLIRTAQVYHLMKTAPQFGLPEVKLPRVDYTEIRKRIQPVIQTIQEHDSEERFCTLGARVVFGTHEFSDDHAVKMDGRTYVAKRWVIAAGSSPASPPFEGLSDTPYLTNKDMADLVLEALRSEGVRFYLNTTELVSKRPFCPISASGSNRGPARRVGSPSEVRTKLNVLKLAHRRETCR